MASPRIQKVTGIIIRSMTSAVTVVHLLSGLVRSIHKAGYLGRTAPPPSIPRWDQFAGVEDVERVEGVFECAHQRPAAPVFALHIV